EMIATRRDPWDLRDGHEVRLEPLSEADAGELFARRVKTARPDIDLGRDDRDVVESICRRLDRLPLALELAAAQARVLPLPTILERLEQRLAFLTGGARALPERQQTLVATIEWSYLQLSAEEQAMLAALALVGAGS